MSSTTLKVLLLGPITAELDGRPVELRGAHQRRLLAMLAAADGRVVSTDRLVEQLWNEAPPDAAARTFRTYVARLRRSLEAAGAADGAAFVVTDSPGYRLGSGVVLDADEFEQRIEVGREHLTVGEASMAWQELDMALSMWSGDALGEFASEDWAVGVAVRLEELRLVGRELRVRAQIDAGHHDEAIAEIEAFVSEHPLRETPRRDLMLALYRAGRHAEALRAGRTYADFLAEETGLEPSSAIVELETLIIDRDPRLDAVPHGRRRRGYLLEEPIAVDELGPVHRAHQPSIDRSVAITVISAPFADDPGFVRNFEARAQQVASVEHPSVVPIYDYWREPGGAFLVTRFYEGGTLDHRLARGPVAPDAAGAIVREVAAAIWAAHQRGVAHGNVKASSVWFDDQGQAILGGFSMVAEGVTPQGDVAALAELIDLLVEAMPADIDRARRGRLSELAHRLGDPSDGSVATTRDLLLELDGVDTGSSTDRELESRPTGPNPYKGLAAFSEADADRFFGRTAIVDELATVLRRRRVAALVGPSGSGKSSVMRAGLSSKLRAAGSFVTTMVPGTRPLDELEVALTRIAAVPLDGLAAELADTDGRLATVMRSILPVPDGEVVLTIDQFEELFTVSLPDERDRFLDVLTEAIEQFTALRVVATCRADFLGLVLEHPVAGQLLRDRCVLVTPLTSEELHDAVIGPAEHAGMAVEPALVAEIVGEGYGSPGSLPLVQYALTEAFESATDGVMTLDDYRRLGGVSGVLAQRAEEVFGGLSTEDREAAQRLFSRLVAVGGDTRATRRRALRSELTTVPDDVIDAFGQARLISFDRDQGTREPTVEVTHEALITHWPRLVSWITDESDGLRLLSHVSMSAHEWANAGRDDSLVYRGARLEAAEQWAQTHQGELSRLEADFLEASTAERNARQQREQRTLQRLRRLTAGLAVFLAVAVAATTLAVVAQGNADDRADEAAETRQRAEVAALAANARVLAADSPVTAMMLATEASARSSATEPAVASALLDALSADPRERTLQPPVASAGLVLQPSSGPFYTYLFSTEEGARVEVVDTDEGTTRSFDLDAMPAVATTDPTGRFVFTVAGDRLLTHDASSGAVLSDQPALDYFVSNTSPDGTNIAAVDANGDIVVRSLPDFELLRTVEGIPGIVEMKRSGDGRVIAALADTDQLLVATVDGSGLRTVLPLPDTVGTHALDTAGERLALSTTDGVTFIADLIDPQAPPVVVDAAAVSDLAFSPDGQLLAIGTGNDIEILDTTTGESAATPIAFAPGVFVHFSDNRTLRAFSPNQGVVEIDLDATSRIVERVEPPDWSGVGFFTADESVVVALLDDGTGPSWNAIGDPFDPASSDRSPIGSNGGPVYSSPIGNGRHMTADTAAQTYSVFDADELIDQIDLSDAVTPGYLHLRAPRIGTSRDVLVLARDGEALQGSEVIVIDRDAGEVVTTIRDRNINAAELADEGSGELVVGFIDGRVRWIDVDGAPIGEDVTVGAGVGAIATSDDGSLLAIGDWSGTITLFDADRQVVGELFNDAAFPARMAFVGEGARLIVQSEDGSIVLWDIPTRSRIGTLYRADGLRGPFQPTTDGSRILLADATGVASVSIDPNDWERIACDAVDGRRLSQVELASTVPDIEMIGEVCVGS